jgi:hypothetical protein
MIITPRFIRIWLAALCIAVAPALLSQAARAQESQVAAGSVCDDGNPCTSDFVNLTSGGCHHELVSAGTACDDHNACTTGDVCDGAGTCTGASGPAGVACDDGNPCTAGESCDGGGHCQGGAPVPTTACDDGNPCTNDACDVNAGGCVHGPSAAGISCDDANACTNGDVCDGAGACAGTPASAGAGCDDRNSCTLGDACDGAGRCAGAMSLTPGTACDDGNSCTLDDACVSVVSDGSVVCRGSVRDCGDGDLCTTDSCDPHTGQCTHAGCDDGSGCTADRCDATLGCVHDSLENQPCDDQDVCTSGEHTICVNGGIVCGGGTDSSVMQICALSRFNPDFRRNCQATYCDPSRGCITFSTCGSDNNQCTRDYCSFGFCAHDPYPGGTACNDGRLCTVNDICLSGIGAGFCSGMPGCDDGDPCTDDFCDATTGGCSHASRLGQSCSFGPHTQPCETGGVCVQQGDAVVCEGSTPTCDDHSVCTVDQCTYDPRFLDPPPTCSFSAISCNDQTACTYDTCDPVAGCRHEYDPARACNDQNACTTDTCDPVLGCRHADDVSCDDQNVCTTDNCDPALGCRHASDLSCDDQNACTDDTCDPALGCRHAYDPVGCPEEVIDLTIAASSKGSGVVSWRTNFEFDVLGFNVYAVDNRGNRTKLNDVMIPCQECVSGLGSSYSVLVPKHKSSRNIFVDMLLVGGTARTFGPAQKQ